MTWAIPVAAAAALTWILVGVWPDAGNAPRELLRGRDGAAGRDAPAPLAIIAPPNDASVLRTGVQFMWHGRAGQPLFRLTLSEGDRALWSATTRDTTLRPPPNRSAS